MLCEPFSANNNTDAFVACLEFLVHLVTQPSHSSSPSPSCASWSSSGQQLETDGRTLLNEAGHLVGSFYCHCAKISLMSSSSSFWLWDWWITAILSLSLSLSDTHCKLCQQELTVQPKLDRPTYDSLFLRVENKHVGPGGNRTVSP